MCLKEEIYVSVGKRNSRMSTNDRSSLLIFSVSSKAFLVQTTPESNAECKACSSQNQYV